MSEEKETVAASTKDSDSDKKKKKRKHKSRSKSPKKRSHSRSRDKAEAEGSSSDSDSSSSDSEAEKRKKPKKSKDKKKKEKKKKKKAKKEKKSKKKKDKKKDKTPSLSMNEQFGKYGILKESELHSKEAEFYAWMIEVKTISREQLSRKEEKDMFREFQEDFNTATFPSEKYYNLAKWQAEQAARGLGPKEDETLTDEERLLQARRDEKMRKEREKEQARVMSIVAKIKSAKADNTSTTYEKVLARHADDIKQPTFESIARRRREDLAAKEAAWKGRGVPHPDKSFH